MDYDQFIRDEYPRYKLFSETVASILRSAIAARPRAFRLQQITSRAKDPVSLKRKLTERGLLNNTNIAHELKDLAGCRLIFYTNTDVDRFLESHLIFDNFVIDFDGTKIHHAVGTKRPADQLYFGIHYLVSLTEARLSLPEYAHFCTMRCEVQLQTILNHAWAETSHDIVYHPSPMQGFGAKHFAGIKERLEKIMNEYLLPAGYEFQKVQHDHERLLAGKEVLNRGILEKLGAAQDNNARHEQLKRIREDLLPLYDDIPAIAHELIRLGADATRDARSTPTTPITTELGSFEGRTAEQVANEALQLIEDLRYIDVEFTFSVLCDLYRNATSCDERKRIFQSVEALARPDLDACRQVGFGIQKVLFDAIRALPDLEKRAFRPVIAHMCSLFLQTDVQGMASHYNSVSFQRAAVPPSTAYKEFRRAVLTLLFDLYRTTTSLTEKMQVEETLSAATRFPIEGGDDDLVATVLDNTQQVAEFFADRVDDEPFELLQHVEHRFLWLYRSSREMAAGKAGNVIPAKASAVVTAIERFRERVNADDRFVKFKTLVGYESVFPLEWNGSAMNVEAPQKYRSSKITEYADSVSEENAEEWFEIIKLCSAVKSKDVAMFPSFGEFLEQVAARNPKIVTTYLQTQEEVLSDFIPGILAGFTKSDQPGMALAFMNEWVDQGRHLHEMAHYLRYATSTPEELVIKVGEQAIKQKDTIAAIGVIVVIIARQLTALLDRIFLPSMQMLTELKDARLVNGIWYLPSLATFLERLSEVQCKVLLSNLVLRQRIYHQDERVLSGIAVRYPGLVLNFFKARLDRRENGEAERDYQPVPFHMNDLGKILAQDPKGVLQAALSWYSPGDNLFAYTGGRLLQNIFPQFTKKYEAELQSLVRSGLDGEINFVLSLLRAYRGGSFLHEVCKVLIEAIPDDDSRVGQIQLVLDGTGVVSGEFGMVDAYQRKKEDMQTWLGDSRLKVQAFAERHIRTLDRQIAGEQRRSETEYELRRREWEEK